MAWTPVKIVWPRALVMEKSRASVSQSYNYNLFYTSGKISNNKSTKTSEQRRQNCDGLPDENAEQMMAAAKLGTLYHYLYYLGHFDEVKMKSNRPTMTKRRRE
ncbi:hypothetical protein T12_4727 [Trichinella patagoniensis]|uniref:Uncharacterized protein n=1 Tax=Trichinella patagoniensis TaxID=990121 RepID=A0A0V1AAG2_9BILA|nr:hypothetical protein T12_4727 [Trichinella patagoniensis]